MLKAVARHTDQKWVILYVERWVKAQMLMPDGTMVARVKGTPQGGPISPLIANIFLHYGFDLWMTREYPGVQFERFADDVVVRLSPGFRYRSFVQAQGVSGHRPPCVKWMAAIRVVALRKPRARVMRALTWALSASARPFETAWSRVLSMVARYRDRVLASLTNSGMRQRCAQEIMPRSSFFPSAPLTVSASRSC